MATLFAEPQGCLTLQSLTEDYRPRSISEFCGLEKQKRILTNLANNLRPCGLLFEGGPGTGKTSMAFCFSRQIGAEAHHIGSQEATVDQVKAVANMCRYVPLQGGYHVVALDEADKMSAATQLFLLSKLDGTDPCPQTIWIFTCNSTENLQERFLSRLIKLPKFNSYGAGDDIRALLCRIWKERAGDAPEPDFSRVPTGNVREAVQWLETEMLAI